MGETDNFEFERRFFVSTLPVDLLVDAKPSVIVQTYFLAEDGYGLRIRLQACSPKSVLPLDTDPMEAIQEFEQEFDLCLLTAKGSAVGGTRYEVERELDIGIGVEMSLRGGMAMAKRRYGMWVGQDGWVIDQFAGANYPLIIAECERTSPVTDLEIPSFCITEVTDDYRFSNDSLAHHPFREWADNYQQELLAREHRFKTDFGTNRHAKL